MPCCPLHPRRLSVQTALTVQPQRLTVHNRAYLTAPCVMIVEGVLNQGLVPADALIPEDWNSVPIVINHPLDAEGLPMSARHPEVLAQSGVGQVSRARRGTAPRQGHPVTNMAAELWLDVAQVAALGGEAVQALQMLETQSPLEVSTAFYSDAEPLRGSFHGVPYVEVHRNLRPDHLPLLPNAIGACNWSQGCGAPRLHHEQGCTCHTEETRMDDPSPGRWQRLLAALRPLYQFVQEEDAGPGPGAPASTPTALYVNGYFVADGAHAAACTLARQLPTPPVLTLNQTDTDLREALYGALAREMGVDGTPVFIDSVDAVAQTFTYRCGEKLTQRSWTTDDAGVITLHPTVQDVQRVPTYVPVGDPTPVPSPAPGMGMGGMDALHAHEETPTMPPTEAVKARVSALIAHAQTAWEAGDRPVLEAMSEAQLQRLVPAEASSPTLEVHAPATLDETIGSLPPQFREVVGGLVRTHEERKQTAIATLIANKCPLGEERLKAMTLEELEGLITMAIPPQSTYLGRGLPSVPQTAEDEAPPPPDTLKLVVEKQRTMGLRP